jgi:predicted DsbA family dithiol-disulfide isomerase
MCSSANAYLDAVAADVRDARSLGVSGVPFFVLDGRYGVSGAQATEVFSEALTAAWRESATTSSASRS